MFKAIGRSHRLGALLLGSTALVSAMGLSPEARAQAASPAQPAMRDVEEPATGLDDIVVTAERRSESVQSTAIAISAVGGESLQERQIFSVEGLSDQVPNLEFGRNAGDAKVFIRGVGYDSISPGGETRVALYNDGIYQARSQSGFLSFYDVDRVEVLRGPQGTLYGRNATAGALNTITREPTDDLTGYVTGRIGNYDLVGLEAAVGGPVSESVSARLAIQTVDRGGYGTNIGTGEDVNDERKRNVRLKVKFEPSDAFSIRLAADYGMEDDHNGGYRYISPGVPGVVPLTFFPGAIAAGAQTPSDPQDNAGFGPRLDLETYGFSSEAVLRLGPSTDLVSLTGFRHLRAVNQSNFDSSTVELTRQTLTDDSDVWTQELRLSHSFGDFADILVGGYYFHEESYDNNVIAMTGLLIGLPTPEPFIQGFDSRGRIETEATALFGEARIHFRPDLTLTLGARYSDEEKTIDEGVQFSFVTPYDPNRPWAPYATQQASTSESRFDPKATLAWEPTDDLFFYLTWARGFKSGGFNIGGVQPAFDPEVIEDLEGGVKADLFDRRLRINLAAFHYDYTNLQVNIVEGIALVTRNAAEAKIDGLELELMALPIDNLRLSFNAAYLDARYTEYDSIDNANPGAGVQDLSGNRLNYSPEWKLNGEVAYTFETSYGAITPRLNVTWVDEIFFDQFNKDVLRQGSRTNVDAYLGYESVDGLWSASLYGKNLTDDTYLAGAAISAGLVGFPILGQYGPPRTFGVSVTRRF